MMEVREIPNGAVKQRRAAADVALAVIAAGCAVMAAGRAALTWDGSYYLYVAQHSRGVPVFYARYSQAILLTPTWLAAHASAGFAEAVFCATYAAVPLGVLLLCRWLTAGDEGEMLWALIGVGVIALPGQIFLVSEAGILAQLAWPLLLAIRHRHPMIAAALAAFAACLHPFAFLVLAPAAAYAMWTRQRSLAVICAVLPVTALFQRVPPSAVVVDGAGIVPVILAATAMVTVVMVRDGRRDAPALIAIAAVIGGIWGLDAHLWSVALDYRVLVILFMLPWLVAAIVVRVPAPRPGVLVAIAALFTVVVTAQTLSWQPLLRDAHRTSACATTPFGGRSPLDHWATPALARVLGTDCTGIRAHFPRIRGLPSAG